MADESSFGYTADKRTSRREHYDRGASERTTIWRSVKRPLPNVVYRRVVDYHLPAFDWPPPDRAHHQVDYSGARGASDLRE